MHAGVEEEEDNHAFEESGHERLERFAMGWAGDPSDEQTAEQEKDGGVEERFAEEG